MLQEAVLTFVQDTCEVQFTETIPKTPPFDLKYVPTPSMHSALS